MCSMSYAENIRKKGKISRKLFEPAKKGGPITYIDAFKEVLWTQSETVIE